MKVKIINCLMQKGNKQKAICLYKKTCEYISTKYSVVAEEFIQQSVQNSCPAFELKKMIRFSGVIYIPIVIDKERQLSITVRRFIKEARRNKKKNIVESLGEELILSYNFSGKVYSQKIEDYKVAENNRVLLFDFYKK